MNKFYELYGSISSCDETFPARSAVLQSFAQACKDLRVSASGQDESATPVEDCLRAIANQPNLLAIAIAEWLTDREHLPTAKELVHVASIQYLREDVALKFDMGALDKSRVALAGCRLCTLGACPAISLGWALSLAEGGNIGESPFDSAIKLIKYHIEEFPGTTLRMLGADSSPFKTMLIAQEALSVLAADSATMEAMPPLRELSMTPEMRLLLAGLKRAENREINERADDNSILAKLFTSHHFKYANKTSIEIMVGDQPKETTLAMQPYGFSIELPLSEGTDPFAGMMRRNAMWKGVLE